MDKEYLKSLFRCPICGTVVGCKFTESDVECILEDLRSHVLECRGGSRVKPGRIRYTSDEE